MILRAVLSLLLCLAALAVGLYTSFLASKNRALGAELDSMQRWCETFQRQNALFKSEIEALEFLLLHPEQNAEPGAIGPGGALGEGPE